MATRSVPVPADFSPWVLRVVRLGFFAKGLIYALIGILAFRLAIGMRGGKLVDSSGVLRTLLGQPFGLIMLAVICFGILGYAAYYVFEAVMDTRRRGGGLKGWTSRTLTIIKAVAYGTIGVEALRLILGDRTAAGGPEATASTVMLFPLGAWFLVLVGLGIAIYGVMQLRMTRNCKFDDDLDEARVRRDARWLLTVGRLGIGARSIILVLMGVTLAWAGIEQRPSNADGYRESLTMLFFQPFGGWLLAAIGGGLFLFGLFQLAHVKYARIE